MAVPDINGAILRLKTSLGVDIESYFNLLKGSESVWLFSFKERDLSDYVGYGGIIFICHYNSPKIGFENPVFIAQADDFSKFELPVEVGDYLKKYDSVRTYIATQEEPLDISKRVEIVEKIKTLHKPTF